MLPYFSAVTGILKLQNTVNASIHSWLHQPFTRMKDFGKRIIEHFEPPDV